MAGDEIIAMFLGQRGSGTDGKEHIRDISVLVEACADANWVGEGVPKDLHGDLAGCGGRLARVEANGIQRAQRRRAKVVGLLGIGYEGAQQPGDEVRVHAAPRVGHVEVDDGRRQDEKDTKVEGPDTSGDGGGGVA